MASVAARIRAPLTAAFVLAVIAAVPWRAQSPDRRTSPMVAELAGGELPKLIDPLPRGLPELPDHYELMIPPPQRDARPWPEGMVIAPPVVDPGMLNWSGSPLANMLSVFLVPLRALTG